MVEEGCAMGFVVGRTPKQIGTGAGAAVGVGEVLLLSLADLQGR